MYLWARYMGWKFFDVLFRWRRSTFLVAYSFFAIRLVKQIQIMSIFSVKKIMMITLFFYGIILFLYTMVFSSENDFIAATPVLRTLFFGFLGGCFDLVK